MSGASAPDFIAASYVSHSEIASAACSALSSAAARHSSSAGHDTCDAGRTATWGPAGCGTGAEAEA